MKAAIIYPAGSVLAKVVAGLVGEGIAQAGGESRVLEFAQGMQAPQCELAVVGIADFMFSKDFSALGAMASLAKGTRVRVFCIHSGGGKAALDEARAQVAAAGLCFDDGLLLELKGVFSKLGRGVLDEGDRARAKAFGERAASAFLGRKRGPASEKNRIAGYRK